MWYDKPNSRVTSGSSYLVSQFTLLASVKKGNKPDFHQSANGSKAKELYQAFFKKVQDLYEPDRVKDGVFAAIMDVALVNDGPVGIDYTCLDNEVQPQHSLDAYPGLVKGADEVVRLQSRSIPILPKWRIQLRLAPVESERQVMAPPRPPLM